MPTASLHDDKRHESLNGTGHGDHGSQRQRGRSATATNGHSMNRVTAVDQPDLHRADGTHSSLDHSSSRPGKLYKALGAVGNGFQKIVDTISSSSPTPHKRSRSVPPRDDKPRTNPGVVGGAVTQLSPNGALDLSVLNGRGSSRGNASDGCDKRQPGLTGLRNHGNTCFMNAVIQCLSNTQFFAEYFLSNEYRATTETQTNRTGAAVPLNDETATKTQIEKLNRSTRGESESRGELSEHLARLFRGIWAGNCSPETSGGFKTVVGRYGSQYEGSAQNDAQEFLLWLLDKLHEDRIGAQQALKPTIDHENNNVNCSTSIIHDLFQAKYRSTLTCPICEKQSVTYDPFLSVSLPIQQKYRVPVYVTIVRRAMNGYLNKIGLLMKPGELIRDLRRTIAESYNIAEERLLIISIEHYLFQRTFHDDDAICDIEETETIYAIETQPMTEERGPDSQILSSKYITIVSLNNTYLRNHKKRVGNPFVIEVSRDATTEELRTALLNGMRNMLRENAFRPALSSFYVKIVDGATETGTFLSSDVDMPLFALTVDQALNNHVKGSGPLHVKLMLEWQYKLYKSYLINTTDNIFVEKSVKNVKAASQQTNIASLDDCFQIFTRQERLGSEDTWNCPNCRKSQLGTIKTLSLCSLPDVLIIHLKRFKQDGDDRTKLNTFIRFPIVDLDMSDHVDPESCDQGSDEYRQGENSTCKGVREDYLYDLYAVCNHIGNMQGGHYTAFCKNPLTGCWFTFDDAKVSDLRPTDIVTKHAYLLFYQRRAATSRCQLSLADWVTTAPRPSTTSASTVSEHSALFQETEFSCDPSEMSLSIVSGHKDHQTMTAVVPYTVSEPQPRSTPTTVVPYTASEPHHQPTPATVVAHTVSEPYHRPTSTTAVPYTASDAHRPPVNKASTMRPSTALPPSGHNRRSTAVDVVASSTPVMSRSSDRRTSSRNNTRNTLDNRSGAPPPRAHNFVYEPSQQRHRPPPPSAVLPYDPSLLRYRNHNRSGVSQYHDAALAKAVSRNSSRSSNMYVPDQLRAGRYPTHSNELRGERARRVPPPSGAGRGNTSVHASERSVESHRAAAQVLGGTPALDASSLMMEKVLRESKQRKQQENRAAGTGGHAKEQRLQESSV